MLFVSSFHREIKECCTLPSPDSFYWDIHPWVCPLFKNTASRFARIRTGLVGKNRCVSLWLRFILWFFNLYSDLLISLFFLYLFWVDQRYLALRIHSYHLCEFPLIPSLRFCLLRRVEERFAYIDGKKDVMSYWIVFLYKES